MDGVKLYPLFDELGDMLAMSFEYKKKVKDEEVTFFETYTANARYKWKQQSGEWNAVIEPQTIKLMKIPGAYAFRHVPIYHGLSHIREEIEYRGVSVIIPRRECIQTLARKKRSK